MEHQKKTASVILPVRLSLNANTNLNEITGYIAFIQKQPLNAIRIGDGLLEAIETLSINPWKYKECEQLPSKNKIYRQVHYKSWYIIYKISTSEIIVLGIVHMSRNPVELRTLRRIK